jgi:hypothetical protein
MTAGLHDHRRGDDGAARRGYPDLVDPRDPHATVVPEPAFMAEIRDDEGHGSSG